MLQDTAKPCTAVILSLHGFNYHHSTTAILHSNSLYFVHSTMALLHSTWLYIRLFHSTLPYNQQKKSTYITLLNLLHSTMALPRANLLHFTFSWLYYFTLPWLYFTVFVHCTSLNINSTLLTNPPLTARQWARCQKLYQLGDMLLKHLIAY